MNKSLILDQIIEHENDLNQLDILNKDKCEFVDKNYWKNNPAPEIKIDPDDGGISKKLSEKGKSFVKINFLNIRDYFISEDLGKLNQIVNDIENAKKFAEKYNHYKQTNNWYLSKCFDTDYISLQLNRFLVKTQKSMYHQFSDTLNDLKENKNELQSTQNTRKKLDQIVDEFNVAYKASEERKLELVPEYVQNQFSEYQKERKSMLNIEKEIDKLKEDYLLLSSYDNPRQYLKKLKRKTKTKGFFKRKLGRQARRLGFYEGVIDLNKLNQEAKDLLTNDHFNKVLSIENKLNSAINDLEDYDPNHPNFKHIQKKCSSYKLNDFNTVENLILLGDKVMKYQELIKKVSTGISQFKQGQKDSLEEKYKKLKSESGNVPTKVKDISDYVSNLTAISTQLNVIKNKCKKVNHNNLPPRIDNLKSKIKSDSNTLVDIIRSYNQIVHSHHQTSELKTGIKKYGLSVSKIESLLSIKNSLEDYSQKKITYQGLKKEYSSVCNNAKKEVTSLADYCLDIVDKKYQSAEKDSTVSVDNLEEIKSLYGKLHLFNDISERLTNVNQLISKRKGDLVSSDAIRWYKAGTKKFYLKSYLDKLKPHDKVFRKLNGILLEDNIFNWEKRLDDVKEILSHENPTSYSSKDVSYLHEVVYSLNHCDLLIHLADKNPNLKTKLENTVKMIGDYSSTYSKNYGQNVNSVATI